MVTDHDVPRVQPGNMTSSRTNIPTANDLYSNTSYILLSSKWLVESSGLHNRGHIMAQSILRQIVAGPRSRHPDTGLDLCYVTDNSKSA